MSVLFGVMLCQRIVFVNSRTTQYARIAKSDTLSRLTLKYRTQN